MSETSGGIERARAFADQAHGDQRYGDEPYVAHLDEVAGIVRTVAEHDPELVIMAYLHDVVEDTEVTLADVGQHFGEGVMGCVDLLTDSPGRNRKERKAATYARLARVEAGPLARALVVKVADRLANVRRCRRDGNRGLLAMYRKEHATFRAAAHRDGVVSEWWSELDRALET
ncbi:MAG: HD domain-containing protein [Myxococcota bacterium]